MSTFSQKLKATITKIISLASRLWKWNAFAKFIITTTAGLLLRDQIYLRLYRKYHKLPHGPNGVPIFGVLFYPGMYLGTEEYHAYHLPKYGPIVSYPTMMQQTVLINDPSIARKLYSNPNTWNRYEPFLHNVSNTITFLNGPKWLSRRKNIHTNLIATINTEVVTKGSLNFLKAVIFPYLDKHKQITNTKYILRPLTFNLVLFACIGKHIQSLDDPFFVEFERLATQFWANLRWRMFTAFVIGNGFLYNNICKQWFNLTKYGENIRNEMVKLVVAFSEKQIKTKESETDKQCFMDYVRDTKCLNDEELFADITSLLFPSIDTTSNILGFCLLLLCKYPIKVQRFIYETELQPVFNGNIEQINLSQNRLAKLPYFRAFVHETMRIYPTTRVSAPHYLSRNAKAESVKIEIDGKEECYEINENMIFSINTIGIHRNPLHWVKDKKESSTAETDMMKVHFEFWMDENGAFKPNKSLTIFSLGRRECVGKQVAIKNLYVCLAALMLRYRFSVDEDCQHWEVPTINHVLYAPGNAQISVTKREC